MYDLDDSNSCSTEPSYKRRKMNMTLDLQSAAASIPTTIGLKSKAAADKLLTAAGGGSDLLATPDLGMFMLASPDLERFIVQPNGLVLTTPTPTSVLFPKSVTEEQEAYARGFIDALAELHKNGSTAAGSSTTTMTTTTAVGARPTTVLLSALNQSSNYVFAGQPSSASSTRTATLPMMVDAANNNNNNSGLVVPPPVVKVETAQTVPSTTLPLPSSSSSVDMKPIDMDEQEHAKLERKRARNRLAATRCRNRKLERISRLEERVAELKVQNGQLMQSATALREEVARLKRGIVEHTRRGCQVMLSHSLL